MIVTHCDCSGGALVVYSTWARQAVPRLYLCCLSSAGTSQLHHHSFYGKSSKTRSEKRKGTFVLPNSLCPCKSGDNIVDCNRYFPIAIWMVEGRLPWALQEYPSGHQEGHFLPLWYSSTAPFLQFSLFTLWYFLPIAYLVASAISSHLYNKVAHGWKWTATFPRASHLCVSSSLDSASSKLSLARSAPNSGSLTPLATPHNSLRSWRVSFL